MADALAPIRWLIGARPVTVRSVLPPDVIADIMPAHRQAPFESDDRTRLYRVSGWSSRKAAGVRIARGGVWPFTGVTNMKWSAHADGSVIRFSENLLFQSWIAVLLYGGAMVVVLATLDGPLDGGVLFGMIFGVAVFLLNRWVGRNDFAVLVEHLRHETGSFPLDDWALEPAGRPTPVRRSGLQSHAAGARPGFGRRGHSPFEV